MKQMLEKGRSLDGEPEDGHDAIHRLVLPPDGAAAVRGVVPVTRARRVQPRSVLLHDHTRH